MRILLNTISRFSTIYFLILLLLVVAPKTMKLEPIGRWYQAYALRQLHKHSLSHASLSSSGSDDSSDGIDSDGEEDPDLEYDPKNWKVFFAIRAPACAPYSASI